MKRWPVSLGAPVLPRLAILLSLLPVLPSPSAAIHEFKDWRKLGDVEWGAAENPDIGINHAVILFDGHIVDDSDRAARSGYSRYRSVRVFDATGADESRTVQIPYGKGWKISRIKARTVKPSGEIIAVREDDIHEMTILSIGKNRIRAKVFAFKGVEPGDIVEFMYTARNDGLAPPFVQIQGRAYTQARQARSPASALAFEAVQRFNSWRLPGSFESAGPPGGPARIPRSVRPTERGQPCVTLPGSLRGASRARSSSLPRPPRRRPRRWSTTARRSSSMTARSSF